MPKFLIVIHAYVVYLLLLLYCGALTGCPDDMYLKTKLRNVHLSGFLHLLQKVKCLGDVLDSVSLPPFATLRSQLLDVFII